jgi:hypothetical protein
MPMYLYRVIQLSILIHFACIYCIWFDHVNLQSNIIPRNLTSLTISSICVPIFKTNLPNFRFLEKITNSYTLRTIYFALIRSKIDYGCEVYNSASHAVKKLLDNNIVYGLTMSIYNQILYQGI